ncbi:MAG: NAD-dependent epimerase/dehydratase family protein [Bacillota bacterium]|nr:NAD-dependent epimerase/dehydratase family protein [Bacillota bacterium]
MTETNNLPDKKVCLVTGAAGFIGSHLARRLVDGGSRVIGIDCFTDYYDRSLKEKNIEGLKESPLFELIEADIADIGSLGLEDAGIELIFHQAAQAGVRASWGGEFAHYTHHNVLGTQRLLEWARRVKLQRFVYASSSSVYGNSDKLPMNEADLPKPMSPYGVTKLAAEHLCNLYHQNFNVPSVSLRYFTVYGPGQRPDMAFNRFIRAILAGEELVIYGNGEQTRDFTFIDDIVNANLAAAASRGVCGWVYNIGGGSRISVNGVLEILGHLSGKKVKVRHEPVQAGDPPHTYADTSRARGELGFMPQGSLEEGLQKMIEWFTA